MSGDDKKERSRFSAVAEELTTPAEQLKATRVVKAARAPQLFETCIKVVGGEYTPCPKCGNTAYSVNAEKSSVTCRGCPPPTPTYPLEFPDKTIPVPGKLYRCACGGVDVVTIDLAQVNLYCRTCGRLALHDRVDRSTPRVYASDVANMVVPTKAEMAALAATIAEMNLGTPESDKPYGWLASPEVEKLYRETKPLTYSLKDIALTKELFQQFPPEPVSLDVDELVDEFREQLGLKPFGEYARTVRAANKDARVDPVAGARRTGRTTRGLLAAIATVVINKIGVIRVKGGNQTKDRELVVRTWDFYTKLGLKTMRPLHTVKPVASVTMRDEREYLYTDHHWYELNGFE